MVYGETLFHIGIAVLCASGAVGLLSVVIFSVTGRRLKRPSKRNTARSATADSPANARLKSGAENRTKRPA